MKKPLAQLIPLLAKGVAPTAAVASGLMSPGAFGASGDLDPTFGDVGRVTDALDFAGTAWSVQPLANDASIFAGGRESSRFYYSSDYIDEGFEGRLTGTGSLESRFGAIPARTEVRDIALQDDGKPIAVGRTLMGERRSAKLTVFRLESDGSLDATFGSGGVVQLSQGEGAQSVTLDTEGRIVVAGTQHSGELMVVRLLANGAPDTTFGTDGIFVGPITEFARSDRTPTRILHTAGGGYRVSTSACSVVALTAQGALDTTFGNSGIAALDPPPSGDPIACSAMVAQANGRLLLAGQEDGHGFAVRLLTGGSPDPSFDGTIVASSMVDVTALAIDGGSILVAGRAIDSVPAALVMRLQADGTLDGLFGNSGSTWIDLPSDYGLNPVIHDMSVLADGRILAAGGDDPWAPAAHPFVARLLGNTGGGPGVLGMQQSRIVVDRQSHEAVIPVRRMGGATGEVSVRYQITTSLDSVLPPATPGEDFTPVTGRVTWSDGETQDQEVRVPILSNGAASELPERFIVTLDDVQGQAGLGTRNATVDIDGNLQPAGRFGFQTSGGGAVAEGTVVEVWVDRSIYATGAVSVTVTPTGGTATANADFAAEPVTLSWSDGDNASKPVRINITADRATESVETFTLQLSNPTGGAFIGPMSTMTVAIRDNQSMQGGGGGGAFGFLSVFLLGAIRLLRTLMRWDIWRRDF